VAVAVSRVPASLFLAAIFSKAAAGAAAAASVLCWCLLLAAASEPAHSLLMLWLRSV